MNPKLYLAGPEVFLPNAAEHAEQQRALCRKYGFIPLHPMDNNLDLGNNDIETAVRIYYGDVKQVAACDIIVANCNSFRGVCIDDGTAYELGYGNALGKPSYGYIRRLDSLVARTKRQYPNSPFGKGIHIDMDGYLIIDDYGTSINLMMQCGMMHRHGRLVEGDFEKCLCAIRTDLDKGSLLL